MREGDSYHVPIMADEICEYLSKNKKGVFVDGTMGGGGHLERLIEKNPKSRFLAIDRDEDAIKNAQALLNKYEKLTIIRDNFCNIKTILQGLSIEGIDGAIIDLGVSSHQLDEAARGFSYMHDAPLDMRMDTRQGLTAYDVINSYSEGELSRILRDYGEERHHKRLAAAILKRRKASDIKTTGELAKLVSESIPFDRFGGHPAKRAFMAVRIETNGELDTLERAIEDFVDCLNSGGRLAVLTFHSLEDRIVKQVFKRRAEGCICDKAIPVCVCGHAPEIKLLTKAQKPSNEECKQNSRSKSAKLRVIEKL